VAGIVDPQIDRGGLMPEGEELDKQLAGRRRTGRIWLALLQFAVIVAVVSLLALLGNIINDTFGLAAVQNEVQPSEVVAQVMESKIIAQENTLSSEHPDAILAGVAENPFAIGFVSYAHLAAQDEGLQAVVIDGIAPNAETVEGGEYALARPLYLYVRADVLRSKPEVAAFSTYYLSQVNQVAEELGFFPPSAAVQESAAALLAGKIRGEVLPVVEGDIAISGSATLYPLTEQVVESFVAETAFAGEIRNEAVGTKAGFDLLCDEQSIDIAAASRAMQNAEIKTCNNLFVDPVGVRVGTDAIAVVVNQQNDFATDLTGEQLRAIFAGAKLWSEVDASWPAEPIVRFIPGSESGTLDFFVETVYNRPLAELGAEEMIALLNQNVSKGVIRRLESEAPLAGRTSEELLALVEERIIKPTVVDSWNLFTSLFNRQQIEQQALTKYPDANVEWYRWLNRDFLKNPQSSVPQSAGVRTAILGSLWVILITMLVAIPVGIGSAIWLEEYATKGRLQQIIQTNIDNLAGVPSIIYGILGLTVFVRLFGGLTSGAAFGVADPTTANGRTVLSAGLTLALLVLPVVIINAQEAIRAVPKSLREAGYGLGATKWQVTWSHVLSNALPGIFTGTILAMSRALGETAPLIVVGASTFITQDPTGPFSKFTVLPMQIYQWTSRPQAEFRHIAAAASLVLLALLLLLNGSAIFLRNRYSRKL